MPMTGVISGVVTPKDKTKSNPLARQKVRTLSKSVISFYSFPVSLSGGSFHSQRETSIKHGSKMSRDNKSASLNDKLDLEVY